MVDPSSRSRSVRQRAGPAREGSGPAPTARSLGKTMRSAIVRATDRDQWLACMQSAGAADVYYLPEYHRLYEFQGVQCLAYAASVGGESLFHPFLLRPIARIGE